MPFSILQKEGKREEVRYTMGNWKKSSQNGTVVFNSCHKREILKLTRTP